MKSIRPVLAAALCFAAGCSRPPALLPPPPAPRVEGDTVTFPAGAPQLASLSTQKVETTRLALTHLTGRLYWSDDATVRIFTPVIGQVVAVRADVGETVAAGAPLAIISSPDFGQALAETRTAEANLAAADKAFSRAKDLFDHGAAAQKDVEAAEAADAAARAEQDRTRSRLKLYGGSDDQRDEDYVLRTPLAGVVVEKNINPGQEVRNDQMLANAPNLFAPLFIISNPAKLWLQLDVAESDLATLRVGQKLRVHARAFPDQVFSGVLTRISEELDPSTRTVKVRGEIDNPERRLKAEMYVGVDVVQDESRVAGGGVEVPAKAIFMLENRYYLFVQRGPGAFQRRAVEVGSEKDGRIPVYSGLAPGDTVVAEGALLLQAVLDPAD